MRDLAPTTLNIVPGQFHKRHVHLLTPHHDRMGIVAALLKHIGAFCSMCDDPPLAPCPQICETAPDLIVAPPHLTAMPSLHPDLPYALEHQIPFMASSMLLGALMAEQCLCAVVGPGAEEAASWISRFLIQAGQDPSYAMPSPAGEVIHSGQTPLWIVTVDAAFGSFHAFHPRVVLITGIPVRALPGYSDPTEVQRAFGAFIAGMDLYSAWPYEPTVILNDDDPGCRLMAARMAAWPGRMVRYRFNAPDIARRSTGATVTLRVGDRPAEEGWRVTVPAMMVPHLAPLLGAIYTARYLDVDPDAIVQAVSTENPVAEALAAH